MGEDISNNKALISNRLYDFLKLLTLVLLPGAGTLYVALSAIWGLPAPEQVSATIVAIVAFLGLFIKVSDKAYNASGAKYVGTINVIDTHDKKVFSLDLDGDPEAIQDMKEVNFRVNPPL